MRAKTELKAWAVRQRTEERRSLDEIRAATGVARSTLSLWLRPYPLTGEERTKRRIVNHRGGVPAMPAGEPSKFYQAVAGQGRTLSARDKGRIAETAVLFHLAVQGFTVFSCVFEGDKADFVVEVAGVPKASGRRLVKAQVKWVTRGRFGRPLVRLTCASNSRPYEPGDFDFLVGYDLFTDTAYVYAASEVAHLRAGVSVSDAAAERWDKLRGIKTKNAAEKLP